MNNTTNNLQVKIAKGWRPHQYLTNMAVAQFGEASSYVAKSIFPLCPVSQSTGYYYKFSKADLARDNVQAKPRFGHVQPAIVSETEELYRCEVDQILTGVDQLGALDYTRAKTPGSIDPFRRKVPFVVEQMNIHLDRMFAEKFFQSGVWNNEWTGVPSAASGNQFLKFTDANFDPISFFDARIREMQQNGRRRPNKLVLGANAFDALKNHPDILERVKYGGATTNPARVTENVLAQLFGLEEVKVLESTFNSGGYGVENMQFICNPNDALLAYTTKNPAIDEPSAGYIFTWDMLGDGNFMAIDKGEGHNFDHAEFVEGLMATDMKVVSQDLGLFLKGAV